MEINMGWIAIYITIAIILAIGFIGLYFETKLNDQKENKK